jgi:hypothetical protein
MESAVMSVDVSLRSEKRISVQCSGGYITDVPSHSILQNSGLPVLPLMAALDSVLFF